MKVNQIRQIVIELFFFVIFLSCGGKNIPENAIQDEKKEKSEPTRVILFEDSFPEIVVDSKHLRALIDKYIGISNYEKLVDKGWICKSSEELFFTDSIEGYDNCIIVNTDFDSLVSKELGYGIYYLCSIDTSCFNGYTILLKRKEDFGQSTLLLNLDKKFDFVSHVMLASYGGDDTFLNLESTITNQSEINSTEINYWCDLSTDSCFKDSILQSFLFDADGYISKKETQKFSMHLE